MNEKILPFYQLLRKGDEFETTQEQIKALETLKKDLLDATEMTLRLPKPDLQYVVLRDARYYGAGFVLMVEDYVKGNKNKEKKIYIWISVV